MSDYGRMSEGRTVIFDCDGTLVDVSGIRHYIMSRHRNFDKFHKASRFCKPNIWVLECARAFAGDSTWKVAIVTARDEKYRKVTEDWLDKHEVAYDTLRMRPWSDGRKDAVVKQEILDRLRSDGYDVVLAFDDNPSVLRIWEDNGITIVPVYTNNELWENDAD